MVSPTKKREAVAALQASYSLALRRACRLVGQHRSAQTYRPSPRRDATALRHRMRELVAARPRYDYRRVHTLLRREGWRDGLNRVHRIYKLEGMQVRTKGRKKRKAALRITPLPSTMPNARWTMDFMYDTLDDGRPFRVLTVLDTFDRSSLALEPSFRFTGKAVGEVLDRVAKTHDYPAVITVDNGTEFASRALDQWAFERSIKLDFIRPGKPTENAFIESFNGKFRDECLNAEVFISLDDARKKFVRFRVDYNTFRPHSSLGNATPSEYRRKHLKQPPAK